jgi:hypothetical protein
MVSQAGQHLNSRPDAFDRGCPDEDARKGPSGYAVHETLEGLALATVRVSPHGHVNTSEHRLARNPVEDL